MEIKQKLTVEAKIKKKYDQTVAEFFSSCVSRGMESYEIAEELECSVSNLRRIARKHSVTLYQPSLSSLLCESDSYNVDEITPENIYSCNWNK